MYAESILGAVLIILALIAILLVIKYKQVCKCDVTSSHITNKGHSQVKKAKEDYRLFNNEQRRAGADSTVSPPMNQHAISNMSYDNPVYSTMDEGEPSTK